MKKLLGIVLLVTSISLGQPDVSANTIETQYSGFYGDIDNGWYEAKVVYFNYSTYTESTYTLNVKVEYGRVTVIDFGNDGSVHTGYNNSGYYYSGGYLSYDYNEYNQIVAAEGKVTITTTVGNIVTFQIYI